VRLDITLEDIEPPKRFGNSAYDISELYDALVQAVEDLGYRNPQGGGNFRVVVDT
jgi:hypothetical protein